MILHEAERLWREGFALHWLHQKSKRPIGRDWASRPVATIKELKQRYKNGNNLGVRLGRWSELSEGVFLHIIDMDIRKDECLKEARQTLDELFPEVDFDTCPSVRSGSGGKSLHYYILCDKPFPPRKLAHSKKSELVHDAYLKREVKKWDWELHLLGTGAQAVIPPSIHDKTGKPYKWIKELDYAALDAGKADVLPAEVLERVTGYGDEDNQSSTEPLGLSEDEVDAILKWLPHEDYCEDRDGWYRVGMALHHEFQGGSKGFHIWCRFSRKSTKFDLQDAKRVWKSFKGSRDRPFRLASLKEVAYHEQMEQEFVDLDAEEEEQEQSDPTDDWDEIFDGPKPKGRKQKDLQKQKKQKALDPEGKAIPKWIQRLNKKYAIASIKGKTLVLHFDPYDKTVSYGSVHHLHELYEHDQIPMGDTTVPRTKAWMRSPYRRTYMRGVTFAPGREEPGKFNLFQGWSVDPIETANPARGCKLFLDHLKNVICDNKAEAYRYMLGWMAHLIQRPEDKPGVAVVYRGRKGVGKDSVFNYLGRIMDDNYVVLANQEQLTGKFNAQEERVLLLHAEEGFWAGDRKAQGVLQSKITSEKYVIERKGVDAFSVQSCLRLFISSNEEWVVPATEDERRYFILNVPEKKRGDRSYFNKLREEMNGDGPRYLLSFLLQHDISNFDVRDVPNTDGLTDQKTAGLRNVEKWWHSVLYSGSIATDSLSDTVGHDVWANQTLTMEKSELRDQYRSWMRFRRFDGEEVDERVFTKRLVKMLSTLKETRPSKGRGKERKRMFVIPTLGECRREFNKYLNGNVDWGENIDDPNDEDDFDEI